MSKKHRKTKLVDAKTTDGFANFSARMGLGADNVFSRGGYTMSMLSNDRLTLENIIAAHGLEERSLTTTRWI